MALTLQPKKASRAIEDAHDDASRYHAELGETKQAGEHAIASATEAVGRQQRMRSFLRDVDKDKDKLSNKVRYDVETTLNKIKNKLLG